MIFSTLKREFQTVSQMPDTPRKNADELLNLFLNERDEAESDNLLGVLMTEHAQPVMKAILIHGLRDDLTTEGREHSEQEAEELLSELTLDLLIRLKALRAENFLTGKIEKPINNFRAYAAQMAYNKLKNLWRKKNSQWASLKYKIKYLIDTHPRFVRWEEANRSAVCAMALSGTKRSDETIESLIEKLETAQIPFAQQHLLDVVTKVFEEANGALSSNSLTSVVFEIQKLEEITDKPLDDVIDSIAQDATGANEQQRMEARQKFRAVWEEILLLPFRQRFALLLSLRDSRGVELISLLLFVRAVTLNELVESLQMTQDEFAAVYEKLPLSDKAIAKLLSEKEGRTVTEQQVSNLRKTARKRLERKIRFIE
jgi:hypothetical protein